jgi:multidrug efflux pump subunit AcrA (membrane-fusion protein)
MNHLTVHRIRLTALSLMLGLGACAWWPGHVRAESVAQSAAPSGASLRFAVARSPSALASQTFDGHIEAVRDAKVAAQVAGRITQVMVKAGDKVQAGQVGPHQALARAELREPSRPGSGAGPVQSCASPG